MESEPEVQGALAVDELERETGLRGSRHGSLGPVVGANTREGAWRCG